MQQWKLRGFFLNSSKLYYAIKLCKKSVWSTQTRRNVPKLVKIFEKKSSLSKILTDWKEVKTKPITKIVVPNQFPCHLFCMDKLPRVLATCVKTDAGNSKSCQNVLRSKIKNISLLFMNLKKFKLTKSRTIFSLSNLTNLIDANYTL